jgi:hypothetical protein
MATLFSSITKAMKGVDNAVKLGTQRAINRSITSTRSLVNKTIRQETGLKSEYVSRRLILNKTQKGLTSPYSFRANVSIATRTALALRLFNPKPKRVRSNRGYRLGVTVKVGKQARALQPKSFMFTLRNGVNIVAERKGSNRSPIKQSFTFIWQDTVERNYPMFNRFLQSEFDRIVGREIDYAVQQQINRNR